MTVCAMVACAALQAATAAEAAATNAPPAPPPVKIVYPDVPAHEFCVEYWAEELAESGLEGLHVRNGYVLAVVRLPSDDGEEPMLAKLRAKFRAIEVLRLHAPDLPDAFSAPCRVLVCERSGSPPGWVCVVSFKAADLPDPPTPQSSDPVMQ